MKKNLLPCIAFFSLFLSLSSFAGERTVPVDMIIMIDKSLSMEEAGKYESLHSWVRDQLVSQMVIDGDWVSLYQFYGRADNVLTMDVQDDADRQKIISTIDGIKPDGQYTDIGLALDTIRGAMTKRGDNGRHKVLLLLTDLKQEAPWTSRYAGVSDTYDSPYLAEARIIQHDNWYEITLDMDIQNKVVQTTKELYSSINSGESGKDRDRIISEIEDSGLAIDAGNAETAGAQENGANTVSDANGVNANKGAGKGGLPLPAIIVISCVLVGAGIATAAVAVSNRRKKEEQEKTA
ncbi:MAG TPA: vWA domain-containing protein [Treponemataceae bacterium]|nr:vWA domain-containing protein [Treponemataceae bacterium]